MTQCCYKTHREDLRNFPKIDDVAIFQLLRGNTKGIFNQYPNASGVLCLSSIFLFCLSYIDESLNFHTFYTESGKEIVFTSSRAKVGVWVSH